MITARYSKPTSSLSFFDPRVMRKSPLRKPALSARITLAPMKLETKADNNFNKEGNTEQNNDVETEEIFRSASYFGPVSNLKLEKIPPLPKPTDPNFDKILKMKIKLCCSMCDFDNFKSDQEAKKIKEDTLIEITSYLTTQNRIQEIPKTTLDELYQMVKKNILRPIQLFEERFAIIGEFSTFSTPDWPHVQYAYKILTHILKTLPKYITYKELQAYNVNAHAKDPLEKDALAQVYVTYINNNADLAPQFFHHLIKLLEFHNSKTDPYLIDTVLSTLEKLYANISSVRDLYTDIFKKDILPLIWDPLFVLYQNSYFSLLYWILNEDCVPDILFVSTVNFWPVSNANKQEPFLKLLSKAAPLINKVPYPIINRSISILAESVISESAKVAELAHKLLYNGNFNGIICVDKKRFIAKLIPPILKAQKHWSNNVREASRLSLQTVSRLDQRFVMDIRAGRGPPPPDPKEKLRSWAQISRTASRYDRQFNLGDKLSELTRIFNNPQVSMQSPVTSAAQVSSNTSRINNLASKSTPNSQMPMHMQPSVILRPSVGTRV